MIYEFVFWIGQLHWREKVKMDRMVRSQKQGENLIIRLRFFWPRKHINLTYFQYNLWSFVMQSFFTKEKGSIFKRSIEELYENIEKILLVLWRISYINCAMWVFKMENRKRKKNRSHFSCRKMTVVVIIFNFWNSLKQWYFDWMIKSRKFFLFEKFVMNNICFFVCLYNGAHIFL